MAETLRAIILVEVCLIVIVRDYWAWVSNTLVPGWGTGPEKTRFPEGLVLPYIGTWFSAGLSYRADF